MKGIDILKRLGGGNAGSGGATGLITLGNDAVSGTTFAEWEIAGDGFTYVKDSSGPSRKSLPWISPQVGMDHYEVMASGTAGDIGILNTWLPLNNIYTWGWASSSNLHRKAVITVEIRDAVTHVVVATATVTMTTNAEL